MYLVKRNNRYHVIYFRDGKRTSVSCKTANKRDAIAFMVDFERQYKASQNRPDFALGALIRDFLKHSVLSHTPKTTKDYRTTFRYMLAYFNKDIKLADITTNMLSDFLQGRLSDSSIFQARKHRINMHALFNYAIDKGYITFNPVKPIKPFKAPEKLPLFLTQQEYQLLISSIVIDDLRDVVIFAVNTGLREMELVSLQWSQLILADRKIILDNQSVVTKSKRVRHIPINNAAYSVITRRKSLNIDSPYIFTYHNSYFNPHRLSKLFKKAIRSIGLNDKYNVHSLRHTFASWLVQSSVPLYEVKELLGHSDIKMTMKYAHLAPESLAHAVSVLDRNMA